MRAHNIWQKTAEPTGREMVVGFVGVMAMPVVKQPTCETFLLVVKFI